MCSSLKIVFNFKQIAENDLRPAIDFKIIRLVRVQLEFETPGAGQPLGLHQKGAHHFRLSVASVCRAAICKWSCELFVVPSINDRMDYTSIRLSLRSGNHAVIFQ
jgi:hypothetical protein